VSIIDTCIAGIIFTGDSVRAIRDGRKTRTTRMINPQPKGVWNGCGKHAEMPDVLKKLCPELRPRYKPGKRYYVKETCAVLHWEDIHDWIENGEAMQRTIDRPATEEERAKWDTDDGPLALYQVDGKLQDGYGNNWRAPLFMPRWAARYAIEIDDATAIRLHDTTNHLAVQEDVGCWICGGRTDGTSEADCECFHSSRNARDSFAMAWDAINGKRAPWASNPWVWSYKFHLVKPA
jgi:hypothetical protein